MGRNCPLCCKSKPQCRQRVAWALQCSTMTECYNAYDRLQAGAHVLRVCRWVGRIGVLKHLLLVPTILLGLGYAFAG